jgi:hypothetical protein
MKAAVPARKRVKTAVSLDPRHKPDLVNGPAIENPVKKGRFASNTPRIIALLCILAGFSALAPSRVYGQSEIAPDHFDSPNTEPFAQPKTKQGRAAEISKKRFDNEATLPYNGARRDGGVSIPDRYKGETSVGVVLLVISFALVILARLQLGRSFAIFPRAHDLVTRGLYSRLQHPMYVFADLTICGIALATHCWYVLLVLLILMPLQTRNARREGQLLHEKFGERYKMYRRATWF